MMRHQNRPEPLLTKGEAARPSKFISSPELKRSCQARARRALISAAVKVRRSTSARAKFSTCLSAAFSSRITIASQSR